MKVLVLTTTFPRWNDDPTPAFVYELSKRLRNEGMEIVVLAPHHEGAKFYEEIEGLKVYRFPYFYPTKYQRLCYEGGILHNIKGSWLAKIQVPLLFSLELIFACGIIYKERINIIHSHWIIPNGFVAGIIKRFWNITHLSTAHAADVLALEKLPFRKELSGFIVQNCDSLAASSNYIKEKLEKSIAIEMRDVIKEKIFVQPMGVDTKVFEGLDKKLLRQNYSYGSSFIILFVGRFVEKKGIEYLLEAIRILVSSSEDIKLLLVGDGPLGEKLRKDIKELNMDSNVDFIGKVSTNKLAQFYVLSDVVVVPSIVTASGDTEGMPTVIVEAMAAGKPVVASNVGGIKDVVLDGFNGFLIEQKKPKEIAEKIVELKSKLSLYKRLSQNAHISSKDYRWEVVGKRYAELIRGG